MQEDVTHKPQQPWPICNVAGKIGGVLDIEDQLDRTPAEFRAYCNRRPMPCPSSC